MLYTVTEQSRTDENALNYKGLKIMSNIKKAYQEIVTLLEDNKDVKVHKILDQVIALASAKTSRSAAGSTYLTNDAGDVVAILCYYFKRWMPITGDNAVEFGAKKNTATGLNSMCKEGTSHWTKQQRVAKSANENLLTEVATGKIAPENILEHQAEINTTRQAIVETDLGFATKAEVLEYLGMPAVEEAA